MNELATLEVDVCAPELADFEHDNDNHCKNILIPRNTLRTNQDTPKKPKC